MANDFDDIFDEDADEIDIERKEWEKICRARNKEGFRDGISYGQDLMLQKGFNDGFKQNTLPFHNLARMRGYLCGLIDSDQTSGTPRFPQSLVTLLETLIHKLSDKEKSWLQACGKSATKSSPSPDREDSASGHNRSPDGSTNTITHSDGKADMSCQADTRLEELAELKKDIEKVLKEHEIPCTYFSVL